MATRGFRGTRSNRTGPDAIALSLTTRDSAGPGPYKARCPDHGIHDAIEVEHPLTVEQWGDTWTLEEAFEISYCADCFAETFSDHRLTEQKHDRPVDHLPRRAADADANQIVEVLAARHWLDVYGAFDPSDPEAHRERAKTMVPTGGFGR